MIVAVTGSRRVTAADARLVERVVIELVYEVRPAEVIFGGALGVDTLALCAAQHHVSHRGGTVRAHRSRLVVIVPDTVAAQPHEAREAIRRHADEVVELHQRITRDDGWAAYHARNRAMVDRATHVLGVWTGDPRSGTASCLAYASRMGRAVWAEAIEGGGR